MKIEDDSPVGNNRDEVVILSWIVVAVTYMMFFLLISGAEFLQLYLLQYLSWLSVAYPICSRHRHFCNGHSGDLELFPFSIYII